MKRVMTLLLACSLCGCATTAPKDPGPPSAPPAQPSSYAPANPYHELAPNLWARTMFRGDDGSGMTVEVRHFMVGPGKRTEDVTMDGASVFQVRHGAGTVTIDGNARQVAGGTTFSVPQGSRLAIDNNRGSYELAFNVTTIRR